MSMPRRALLIAAAAGFALGATLAPASACEWMKKKDTTAEAPASAVGAQAKMTPAPHGASVQAIDQASELIAPTSDGATDVAAKEATGADPVAN